MNMNTTIAAAVPLAAQPVQPATSVPTDGKDTLTSVLGGGLSSLYFASLGDASVANARAVAVDILTTGEDAVPVLLTELDTLGFRDGATYGRVISGVAPVDALAEMASLETVHTITQVHAVASAGAAVWQGDAAVGATVARAIGGVDGTGVRVGVLSDSYDVLGGAADDILSGDLPAGGVQVLRDFASGGDEGRAMLQIVHDIAPGADLVFHTAFGGRAVFANGILDLANTFGADIVVDDVTYFAEPFFQDGLIAQAVDTVAESGVAYFSSAGNLANESYESVFRPAPDTRSGVPSTFHDFDPDPAAVDTAQRILIGGNETLLLSFQWDQPFASAGGPGSASDLDVFLTDANGKQVAVARSNNIGGDPVEVLSFTNPDSVATPYFLKLEYYSGPTLDPANPPRIKYVDFGNTPLNASTVEYFKGAPTVVGHHGANGSQAVGAASYASTPAFGASPPILAPYSSVGNVTRLFDADGNRLSRPESRQGVDLVATDDGNTTFFGWYDREGDGFPNFTGTSAAAPTAAAVAALLKEAAPDATPTEIYAALQGSAIDMRAPGIDAATGAGLIQADAALALLTGTPEPEIAVFGNGQEIADGDFSPRWLDRTIFGSVNVDGGSALREFAIRNTGDAALTVNAANIAGPHAGDFTLVAAPASSVAAGGGATSFTIRFDPSGPGPRNATVTLVNSDADETLYQFAIRGEGLAAPVPTNATTLTIEVAGTQAFGIFPIVEILVGDEVVSQLAVTADKSQGARQTFSVTIGAAAGSDTIGVRYTNDAADAAAGNDRNLFLYGVEIDGRALDIGEAAYERDNGEVLTGQSGMWWSGTMVFEDALVA